MLHQVTLCLRSYIHTTTRSWFHEKKLALTHSFQPTAVEYVQSCSFSTLCGKKHPGFLCSCSFCVQPNQESGTESAERDNRLPSETGFHVCLNVRVVPCELAQNSPTLAACLKNVGVQTRGIFGGLSQAQAGRILSAASVANIMGT